MHPSSLVVRKQGTVEWFWGKSDCNPMCSFCIWIYESCVFIKVCFYQGPSLLISFPQVLTRKSWPHDNSWLVVLTGEINASQLTAPHICTLYWSDVCYLHRYCLELSNYCRLGNSRVVVFLLQNGHSQKAFEHLGNALTYDPSNVKVCILKHWLSAF